ncbi:MAG: hypothetical protein IPJ34_42935 [Myxococcales bacterium]|nr:hypothetical protein [Myxococcales bacterium]
MSRGVFVGVLALSGFAACAPPRLAQHTTRARSDLGEGARIAVIEPAFVLAAPSNVTEQVFVDTEAQLRRLYAGLVGAGLDPPPSGAATALYLLPGAGSYQTFCFTKWDKPCLSDRGFFVASDRLAVVDLANGGTLTVLHEAVHPLVLAHFPGIPAWFYEGLSALFEVPRYEEGVLHGDRKARAGYLPHEQKKLAPRVRLDKLFAMDELAFRRDASESYAIARFVCLWLDEKGYLWPFFHRFREIAWRDSGAQAFRDVVGLTLAEAQPVWESWVIARIYE